MFIEQCNIRNVILAGDLNIDFDRKIAHDMYFKDFNIRKDFIYTFDMLNADKGYTYHDPANGSYSCIDHFHISSGLCDLTQHIRRCNIPLNPSKHMPVLLELDVKIMHKNIIVDSTDDREKPIAWHKICDADVDRYKKAQDWILKGLDTYEVTKCKDVKCTDEEHRKQIDDLCEQLVECCLVSDRFLPRVKLKKSNKPYWREEVQPYKTDSIWWHNLWKQCGEPRDGVIHESKTEAHRQYRYATRRYR